mmetsp:Transcript_5187/g.15244  ORF Transcript_5187/g.15244 Transcript_5187/m.15244 type:complete len:228 (+) Transcript_5187:1381-2064(+)
MLGENCSTGEEAKAVGGDAEEVEEEGNTLQGVTHKVTFRGNREDGYGNRDGVEGCALSRHHCKHRLQHCLRDCFHKGLNQEAGVALVLGLQETPERVVRAAGALRAGRGWPEAQPPHGHVHRLEVQRLQPREEGHQLPQRQHGHEHPDAVQRPLAACVGGHEEEGVAQLRERKDARRGDKEGSVAKGTELEEHEEVRGDVRDGDGYRDGVQQRTQEPPGQSPLGEPL